MGHTAAKDLLDLKSELAKIRALDRVVEKKPGIFYFKSIPFLHFHDREGTRWADIKSEKNWLKLAIDFEANAKTKTKFLNDVFKAHEALNSEKKK